MVKHNLPLAVKAPAGRPAGGGKNSWNSLPEETSEEDLNLGQNKSVRHTEHDNNADLSD